MGHTNDSLGSARGAYTQRTMMRMRAFAIAVLCGVLLPVQAGPLDWFSSKLHRQISPALVEARVRTYLKAVVKNPRLKVSRGRSELTGAEKKRLDPKILDRIGDAGDLMVADVAGPDANGLAILASRDIAKPDWDPATDYLAYVALNNGAVFPGDADRALALCAHIVGEPALYGNAPEAGPIWLKKESGGGEGRGGGGGRGGRFNGGSFAGDTSGYRPRAGEVSPDEDEIPAWVTRGVAQVALGGHHTPMKLGVLVALTRGPGGHGVLLTHVTGAGPAGKPIFRDLYAPEVRPLRPQK